MQQTDMNVSTSVKLLCVGIAALAYYRYNYGSLPVGIEITEGE